MHKTRSTPAQTPDQTPTAIVEPDGRVNTGWFEAPFQVANLEAAEASHPFEFLRASRFGKIEKRLRRLRLKQWHYTSVVSKELMFACAVVHAGYIGKIFAYLVERKSGQVYEWERTIPLAAGVRIAPNSVDGTTSYRDPVFGAIRFDNDALDKKRYIIAELKGHRKGPPLSLSLVIEDDGQSPAPVCVVENLARGRWVYTHKCYGLAASGRVSCGGTEWILGPGQALAGLDWNRGYRLTETYWNWAAAGGWSKDGRPLGFNLTSHRDPESGQAVGSEAQDCAVWLKGQRLKVPRVRFDYDAKDLMKPWHIYDEGGHLDLRFRPHGERRENLNLGLVASRFHQPYGDFSGTLSLGDARADLGDVFGVTEQHYARW